MDILHRVEKAARETAELRPNEPEAVARAAIATMFNWLGEPSESAIAAAMTASHQNAMTCHRAWAAILADMRKEAGF